MTSLNLLKRYQKQVPLGNIIILTFETMISIRVTPKQLRIEQYIIMGSQHPHQKSIASPGTTPGAIRSQVNAQDAYGGKERRKSRTPTRPTPSFRQQQPLTVSPISRGIKQMPRTRLTFMGGAEVKDMSSEEEDNEDNDDDEDDDISTEEDTDLNLPDTDTDTEEVYRDRKPINKTFPPTQPVHIQLGYRDAAYGTPLTKAGKVYNKNKAY